MFPGQNADIPMLWKTRCLIIIILTTPGLTACELQFAAPTGHILTLK